MMAEILRDCDAVPVEVRELLEATGVWSPPSESEGIALDITEPGTYEISPNNEELSIRIAPNIDVTILEHAKGGQVNVLVKEHARVKYYTRGWAARYVYMQQQAHLDWVDVAAGKSENLAYLQEGANAKFRGLFVGKDDEQYDVQIKMIHAGSRSSSHMLTRAVLLDSSKGTYRGLIRIMPGAKGCEAHQKEDTLLLGDHARMDAVPILEISNNDVKCSHGVSLGQVDEEQLFYMESKSIPRKLAIDMLVQGFFDQLLISMGAYGQQVRDEIVRKVQHV